MRTRIVVAVVSVALASLPALLHAQDVPSILRAGERVRVEMQSSRTRPFTGVLLDLTPAGLRLGSPDRKVSAFYPADRVARVSVFRGTGSAAGRGAAIGGAVGVSLGGMMAVGAQGGWFAPDLGQSLSLTAVMGAAGAAVGLLFGSPVSIERWERVPDDRLPWNLELTVDPTDRLGLGVAVRI